MNPRVSAYLLSKKPEERKKLLAKIIVSKFKSLHFDPKEMQMKLDENIDIRSRLKLFDNVPEGTSKLEYVLSFLFDLYEMEDKLWIINYESDKKLICIKEIINEVTNMAEELSRG